MGLFINLLFPPRCPICGKLTYYEYLPCDKCENDLPLIPPPLCRYCGREKGVCNCGAVRHIFSAIAVPFYYEGRMISGIYRLKHNNRRDSFTYFSNIMTEIVRREYGKIPFDFITCVPMFPKKQNERAYNPPEVLARLIASNLNIPFENTLKQIFEGKVQHTLSAEERKANVLGIFEQCADINLKGKTILLCDDVITTGFTLDECSKILRLGGAKDVFCIAAAGTKIRKNAHTE